MSLATRCPACGTVFRVVQDQLRVSQGWVRCGRCSEPFNALESMIDLTAPRPAPEPAPEPSHEPPAPPDPVLAQTAEPQPEAVIETPAEAVVETAPGQAIEPAAEPEPEPEPQPQPEPAAEPTPIEVPAGMAVIASDGAIDSQALLPPAEGNDTRAEPAFGFDAAPPAAEPNVSPEPKPSPDLGPLSEFPADLATAASMAAAQAASSPKGMRPMPATPSFVAKADRDARWRQPRVRAALAVAAVLATVLLAGQAVYAYRDRIAASSPSLRPTLQQACAMLGCRVGDYRQIDALSVESSGLTRVEGSSVYRLSVTLRNRAPLDVAAPALDLALTDAAGKPIARRVLQMSDLNLPLRNLKPGSELPIQVPLGIGDKQAVAGYTVEIFYP